MNQSTKCKLLLMLSLLLVDGFHHSLDEGQILVVLRRTIDLRVERALCHLPKAMHNHPILYYSSSNEVNRPSQPSPSNRVKKTKRTYSRWNLRWLRLRDSSCNSSNLPAWFDKFIFAFLISTSYSLLFSLKCIFSFSHRVIKQFMEDICVHCIHLGLECAFFDLLEFPCRFLYVFLLFVKLSLNQQMLFGRHTDFVSLRHL